MGGCLSTAADIYASGNNQGQVEELQRQVHDLQQQLAAKGGGNGRSGGGAVPVGGMYVLWFPIQGMPCRNGGNCRRQGCTYAHQPSSLTRLLDLLYSARSTLDICVFSITCNELADAVIAAHRRGVRVRVITDNDQALSQGSDIEQLRQSGVSVATDKDQFHMHHKYAVVDRRLVLTGSFNWTRQACLNNQEHVLVVDSPQLAGEYTGHFDHLFAKYGGR